MKMKFEYWVIIGVSFLFAFINNYNIINVIIGDAISALMVIGSIYLLYLFYDLKMNRYIIINKLSPALEVEVEKEKL